GRILVRTDGRPSAALAWTGQGRNPSRNCCDGQRRVGSLREIRRQAIVEAARGYDSGRTGALHQLSLYHRCADAKGGFGNPSSEASRKGGPRSGNAASRLSRLYDIGGVARL